ncbi:MAG: NAD(P)/FAD-dependent oxidoreductase [Pseudomonadota bacterium]|nr:MAG: FAD-dependent oxidoreductase [Pseudomonadota bacterium]
MSGIATGPTSAGEAQRFGNDGPSAGDGAGRPTGAERGDGAARVPHVIVIGGGFGGLRAAKRLGSQPVHVTVYDRVNYHLFQPLLYQVALASLGASDVSVPIRSVLSKYENIEVVLGEVVDIDVAARRIRLRDGAEDEYDYLIVAAGAKTNYFGHDAWKETAPGLKDLDDAYEIRRRVLLAFEAAERAATPEERERLLTFVVIGGGATGVELAGAIADLSGDILDREFRHLKPGMTRVVLVEMADRILLPFEPKLSESAVEQLRSLGVEVRTGVRVTALDDQGVWFGDELLPAATVLWGAGVAPSPLARALGVPLDRAGRVIVLPDCSIPGHPEVFVIGDMAAFVPEGETKPLPGVSPVAIQQGQFVAETILRDLRGEPRYRFEYVDKGIMATIGRARAVAQLRKLSLSGFLAWLTWAIVHLWYLVGFRNRIIVFLNWIWAYIMSKHGARVIVGPSTFRPNELRAVTEARRAAESRPPAALREELPRSASP